MIKEINATEPLRIIYILKDRKQALILDAVIGQQKHLAMVVDTISHQVPQLAWRQPFVLQEVTDRIMADPLQVVGQIRAGVVVGACSTGTRHTSAW